jgi:hypothetical protein
LRRRWKPVAKLPETPIMKTMPLTRCTGRQAGQSSVLALLPVICQDMGLRFANLES